MSTCDCQENIEGESPMTTGEPDVLIITTEVAMATRMFFGLRGMVLTTWCINCVYVIGMVYVFAGIEM